MWTKFFRSSMFIALIFGLVITAEAQTIYVGFPDKGVARLEEAIGLARDGDTIEIAAGRYSVSDQRLTRSLYFKAAQGTIPDSVVIDNGAAGRRHFKIEGASRVTFEGIKFIHGGTGSGYQDFGGSFKISGSAQVSFINCVFQGNIARERGAGAIHIEGAAVSIRDSFFFGNASNSLPGRKGAGAIFIHAGTLFIKGTTFKENISSCVIRLFKDAQANIEDSLFERNFSKVGIIAVDTRSSLVLKRSSFSGNLPSGEEFRVVNLSPDDTNISTDFNQEEDSQEGPRQEAPEIIITSSIPAVVHEPQLVVRYTVDAVEKEARFQLREGLNNLEIIEANNSGQEARYAFSVTYISQPATVNHAPLLNPITGSVLTEGESLNFIVSGRDEDADTLVYALSVKDQAGHPVQAASLGISFNPSTGRFRWQTNIGQTGNYTLIFQVSDGSLSDTQSIQVQILAREQDPIHEAQYEGIYYDFRDAGHAPLNVSAYPGVVAISSGFGPLAGLVDEDKIVVGKFSYANTDPLSWSSIAREYALSQQGANILYRQYRNNHHYWFPANKDYTDTNDYFHAKFCYASSSVGVSGSERDEVIKFIETIAAFQPQVRQRLKDEGLIMPTAQMIFRRARVASDEEYLSGKAHPSAFKDMDNNEAMQRMAGAMELSEIPPMIQLTVVEENFSGVKNLDYFEPDFREERLFSTPASLARIFRGREYTKRIVVSADESYDINGLDLTYHWSVLEGDPGRVKINPLNEEKSTVEILIDYQPQAKISGSERLSNRVEIGAFVHNGKYYSAPGFITVFSLNNEEREYENGQLKAISYKRLNQGGYVHPDISAQKDWLRDEFHYDPLGKLSGWMRYYPDYYKPNTQQYDSAGFRITGKDELMRPIEAVNVDYQLNNEGTRLTAVDGRFRILYEYARAQDSQPLKGFRLIEEKDARGGLLHKIRPIDSRRAYVYSVNERLRTEVRYNQGYLQTLIWAIERLDSDKLTACRVAEEFARTKADVSGLIFESATGSRVSRIHDSQSFPAKELKVKVFSGNNVSVRYNVQKRSAKPNSQLRERLISSYFEISDEQLPSKIYGYKIDETTGAAMLIYELVSGDYIFSR